MSTTKVVELSVLSPEDPLEARRTEAVDLNCCPVCGHVGHEDYLRAPDRYHGRTQIYQLVQCLSCSLVWQFDPPKPEQLGQHYGPDYDRAIADAGDKSPQRWLDRTNTLLKYKQGGAILDLGCSSGAFLDTLKGGNWQLYGVEMSAEVAARAKVRCGAKVFVGDILDAPFAAESFDAITCFHVFEHLYYPKEVLTKVSEWLKPGGIFYALMPNIDSGGARVFGTNWYALELPRHLYHFSPKSLSNVARKVGLEELSLVTHREVFIEHSTYYIVDGLLKKIGVSRAPLARRRARSFPRKVVSKAFRMTLGPLLTALISLAGDGESIHAVFEKKR